jgi:polysaccharide pyruvyl transferase WcaK-like protein
MQSKFKANDDLSVLKEFSTRIPNIPFIIHDPQTAQEAGQLIQSVDIVLAERLHTLVISSILGKPFFGLIYDVKVKELIGYLGMSENSININQPFTAEELTDGIKRALDNREQISAHLLKRSVELRDQLSKYFDEIRQKFIKG